MTITPYLNMTGNAEEALNHYKSIFGGRTEIMRWSEMPPNPKMPVSDSWKEKIMHATLFISENLKLYISDSLIDENTPISNNVFLHLEFDSKDVVYSMFDALSQGGRINMPLEKTFWGAYYGDLIDKFGIGWGLHYQIPE